jgi:hypothetical protein
VQSGVVTAFVYASLVISVISAFDYLVKVVRLGH